MSNFDISSFSLLSDFVTDQNRTLQVDNIDLFFQISWMSRTIRLPPE